MAGGIDGKPVSLQGGDDWQQAAFQLEDGLEFEHLVFACELIFQGVEVSHVVLGVCDLLFGKDNAPLSHSPQGLFRF